MQDALHASIWVLKRDADLNELVDTRVFGDEMPDDEAQYQPRACIVLRNSPIVAPMGGYIELQAVGFDAFCYGFSPGQAVDVYLAMSIVLKHARRQVMEATLLHSFKQIMSGRAMREPTTLWPFMLSSWAVLAAENHVAT